jgi:hypothetical protein
LSTPSPKHISIRLEIHIPTTCGLPVVVETVTSNSHVKIDRSLLKSSCPSSGSSNPPSPVFSQLTGSGSGAGSGTGTIHGWAKLTDTVCAMSAVVGPATWVPPTDPTGLNPTPMNGVWNSSPARWEWTFGNEIPGASFSASGNVANVLAFYVQKTSTDPFVLDSTVNFSTTASATDPCFPGSGSHLGMIGIAQPTAGTYPAVWLVAGGGFSVPPLVLFNATWALRPVTATHPTWDNAADGQTAPRVQLKLCPKHGWQLALCFQDAQVRYALPFADDPFGPLAFAERQEVLPGLGAVVLPAILVSAV